MRVESSLNTVGDVVESVILRQHEVTSLVVLGRADNRQRLGKHELNAGQEKWCQKIHMPLLGNELTDRQTYLIRRMSMKIHGRKEGCLRGMGVNPPQRDQLVLVLELEDGLLVRCRARV